MLQYANESSYSGTPTYRPATTVVKALRLLEYIGSNQPVQPAQIVQALGLSRTNVHRLLATLMHVGYVQKDAERGYRLTFKLFQLGSTVPLSRDLRDVANPVMTELMALARENVYLTVLCEDIVIAIEEVRSANHLTLNPDVTYTYPVYACASGKNFVAAMDEPARNKLLDSLSWEKLSGYTIACKEDFLQELETVQTQGYATEILEFSDDLTSMAAPIYDYRKKVVASISVSGPAIRLTEERLEELAEPLLSAASRISEQLGKET